MGQDLKDIIVVGGSHAGLFSAIALQQAGFSVRIFERSPELLSGYGAGIRVQPRMAEMLWKDAGIDLAAASTRTRFDRHLAPRDAGPGNRVIFEQEEDGQFASWGSLYRALLAKMPRERYHCGETCIDTRERDGRVEVCFASGRVETCDLVVHADGITSSARARLNPKAGMMYSGYVAWRGLVPENILSAETLAVLAEARIFVIPGLSHVILYPVPGEGDAVGVGERRVNAIWYRNVAEGAELDDLMTDRDGVHRPTSLKEGALQARHVEAFRRHVRAQLPPAVAEVFSIPEPFVTPIYDVEPSRMAFGRQLLVGDAAAGTRPHVSASTARGMRAAWGLAKTLTQVREGARLEARLGEWEREHLEIAWDFTRRGRMIGRRLQVDGTFVPGDPELTQITMPAQG